MKTAITTNIATVVSLLNNNEVVALPTETVYGLAGNALNENVVRKIFDAKQRPETNPLIVHLKSVDDIFLYASEIPPAATALLDAFAPGPLTVLLPKNEVVPAITTAGKNKVALRVPSHSLMQEVLHAIDFPLAAPSANPFGYISPTNASHVYHQLKGRIPLIFDGGSCVKGLESTIVGFEDNTPVIYRQGIISLEQIQHYYPEAYILNKVENSDSPGHTAFHYAPHTRLIIASDEKEMKQIAAKGNTGFILFDRLLDFVPESDQTVLSKSGSYEEAAANLYDALHTMDARKFDCMVCVKFPDIGIGRTINERLKKAASR